MGRKGHDYDIMVEAWCREQPDDWLTEPEAVYRERVHGILRALADVDGSASVLVGDEGFEVRVRFGQNGQEVGVRYGGRADPREIARAALVARHEHDGAMPFRRMCIDVVEHVPGPWRTAVLRPRGMPEWESIAPGHLSDEVLIDAARYIIGGDGVWPIKAGT